MNFKERIRVFSERFLDLAGITSSPRNQAPYRMSNDLQRSLAHLAALDGKYSRLLRCLESGVLRVTSEGSAQKPFYQGAGGQTKVDIDFIGAYAPGMFPGGHLIATPLWAAISASSDELHTATGTATSTLDLGSVAERCVYVGPMNRAMLVYDSVTAGAKTQLVAQYDTGAHDPQYFHVARRYLDFVNAGTSIDVAVICWE